MFGKRLGLDACRRPIDFAGPDSSGTMHAAPGADRPDLRGFSVKAKLAFVTVRVTM